MLINLVLSVVKGIYRVQKAESSPSTGSGWRPERILPFCQLSRVFTIPYKTSKQAFNHGLITLISSIPYLENMKKLKKRIFQVNTRTIYIFSFLTGIFSGLVAVLFYKAIHILLTYTHTNLTHMPFLEPGGDVLTPADLAGEPNKIFFFFIPIVGGLIAGLVIHYLGKEAAGSGNEVYLDSFHNKAGVLKPRTGLSKFIASVFTLGSNGSGGKEGPMMLIGASLGSIFGRFIKMGDRAQRTLMLTGAAGGLGAIFRTPLGGAITAVEVLYKEDFESDALIPCIISSVTAYTTFGSFMGFGHTLKFTTDVFHNPLELIFYVVLALFCTGAGFVFVKFYRGMGTSFFEKIPIPKKFLPAVGGLLIACVGIFFPESLGGGLGVVQQAIYGTYSTHWITACQFFLLLAVLKMLTTSFTIQSGGSAGLLVPAFFIGAMLGGFVGTIFHHFFPQMVPSVTPFIIVGMAAFFAAVTNASLGALVMVTELTGGYELLPPLMLVCVISLIFSHRWSVYQNQVPNKFFSKAHLWDMNPAILKNISISTAFKEFQKIAIIDRKEHLIDIRKKAHKLHDPEFLVQDENCKFIGLLTLHDLEYEGGEHHDLSSLDELLVAEDMLHGKAPHITPHDTLFKAMQFLANTDFSKVPVVDESHVQSQLLGYITRKDILKFYNNLGEKKTWHPPS